MSMYQVIVGNIGTVYNGANEKEARSKFRSAVYDSKSNVGRAGGQNVDLMRDGEPLKEYFGQIAQDEHKKDLIAEAARAQEVIPVDELEEFAAKQKQQPKEKHMHPLLAQSDIKVTLANYVLGRNIKPPVAPPAAPTELSEMGKKILQLVLKGKCSDGHSWSMNKIAIMADFLILLGVITNDGSLIFDEYKKSLKERGEEFDDSAPTTEEAIKEYPYLFEVEGVECLYLTRYRSTSGESAGFIRFIDAGKDKRGAFLNFRDFLRRHPNALPHSSRIKTLVNQREVFEAFDRFPVLISEVFINLTEDGAAQGDASAE